MLEAFKKRGAGDGGLSAKEQVAELQALIGQAREERAALSTMLTQVELHGSKLSTLGRSLQDVHDRAGPAAGKMDTLANRLSTLEARATGLEEIGDRIETLRGGVRKVEETAQQLLAPDGELHSAVALTPASAVGGPHGAPLIAMSSSPCLLKSTQFIGLP